MKLFLFTACVLVFFFISLVNYYFQKIKYKYSLKEELRRLPLLKAPITWFIFTFISGIVLLTVFVYAIVSMPGSISNLSDSKDTINQYINDAQSNSSEESSSSNETSSQDGQSTSSPSPK